MGKAWIVAIVAVFTAAVGPPPPAPGEPPLEPAGETPIAPPQTPQADCVAQVLQAISASDGRLERALVTRSRRWGEVWRADFERADVDPPLVNRAVCWQGQVQIAVGQSLAPLPVSRPTSSAPSGLRCVYTPFENPCRDDPVEVVSLCLRPSVYLFPDGRSEPVREDDSFQVGFTNHGAAESAAAWARRCAARGGPYGG
jgi:hypothetical protein